MKADKLNGINVIDYNNTVEEVRKHPKLGRCTFRVHNDWITGGHNFATIKDYYCANQETIRSKPFKVEADEPPVLLGEDLGANPVEYALTVLAGCLTTTLIYHAAAQGITIHEVEAKLDGDLDVQGILGMSESVRNGYGNIRVTYRIEADASEEQLKDLVQLAQ